MQLGRCHNRRCGNTCAPAHLCEVLGAHHTPQPQPLFTVLNNLPPWIHLHKAQMLVAQQHRNKPNSPYSCMQQMSSLGCFRPWSNA